MVSPIQERVLEERLWLPVDDLKESVRLKRLND